MGGSLHPLLHLKRKEDRETLCCDNMSKQGFCKTERLESYRAQEDAQRQDGLSSGGRTSLQSTKLVHLVIVLPAHEDLPEHIETATEIVRIRRSYQVQITEMKSKKGLRVSGRSVKQLREAFTAINGVLSKMRLAASLKMGSYICIQKPLKTSCQVPIRLQVDSRPNLLTNVMVTTDFDQALTAHVLEFTPILDKTFKRLVSCDSILDMRIRFGQVKLKEKALGLQRELVFETFALAVEQGLLQLDSTLQPIAGHDFANIAFRYLVQPSLEICTDMSSVECKYELSIQVENKELVSVSLASPGRIPEFLKGKWRASEPTDHLNIIVSSPDQNLDWAWQIQSKEARDINLPDYDNIIKCVQFTKAKGHNWPEDIFLALPQCSIRSEGSSSKNLFKVISTVRLKTSVRIPIQDSPYSVEVYTVQKWSEFKLPRPRQQIYSVIEMYGNHWDESMDYTLTGLRNDRNQELINIWDAPSSFCDNLKSLIKCILQIQSLLDNVNTS